MVPQPLTPWGELKKGELLVDATAGCHSRHPDQTPFLLLGYLTYHCIQSRGKEFPRVIVDVICLRLVIYLVIQIPKWHLKARFAKSKKKDEEKRKLLDPILILEARVSQMTSISLNRKVHPYIQDAFQMQADLRYIGETTLRHMIFYRVHRATATLCH